MESLQSSELSPGRRQVILEMTGAQLAGITEEGGETVEPRHVGLDGQLWVYWRLEVQHGSVRILRDPLED